MRFGIARIGDPEGGGEVTNEIQFFLESEFHRKVTKYLRGFCWSIPTLDECRFPDFIARRFSIDLAFF
jgi:hypothetical protein